jgi:hypothetical protein
MYLLYLDDSGATKNPNDTHVILAGLSVEQRKPYWLASQLDDLARRYWPDNPQGLEFRGSDILSGRRHWRGVGKEDRVNAFISALQIIERERQARIFGAVIHKGAASPKDPMELAFEQLCNRFDRFLLRLHRQDRTDRGIIVLDKSTYETSLQRMANEFRITGHTWGRLRNISEVPLFVDSRATRLVQFADLIAYSIRRYYVNGDARFFDVFRERIDSEGGVIHGLVHYIPKGIDCPCVACASRVR